MKKLNKVLLVVFTSALFLASCSSDDNGNVESLGAYDNGVFVLNEGNTTTSTSSITFISNSGVVEQDVYKNVNPTGVALGTYLQSIFFDDTRAYIISGSANKITVVDRYTFKFIATIATDFANPRYGAVANGKAFVTNSGADWDSGADDFLTVINLSDFTTSQLDINTFTEKITEENGKIYVGNGYYDFGTTVTVVNPNSNVVENVIELGFSPNSFEEEDGFLYVLGSEKLGKINLSSNTLSGTPIVVSPSFEAKNLTIEDDKIYYTIDKSVYAMNLTATTAPTTPLLTYNSTSVYGAMYGFAVENDKIYIADAGNFSAPSQIYIYSTSGSLINAVSVGIGPNGFYFN